MKNHSRDKVIKAETDLAKIFIGKFENIVESLHVERHCKVGLGREPVVNSIKNFSQHPSILKIKENTNSSASFSFHTVNKENLLYKQSETYLNLSCLDISVDLEKDLVY